ncbi:MAG: acyl-CoA dehydrogenase family protein, partial [Gammaproteobacteria bacterium]|nr:acyl-CoA dehydrogenase family protein [Gammaproteobacteria bacterium]
AVDHLQIARELGPLIESCSDEIERIRDLPDNLFERLIEHDLFRLVQPRDYGGAEVSPLEIVRFIEEIGRHDASTAWCLGQNNICGAIAAWMEPDAAREVFSSPRQILAWGPGPGEAHAVPGGYRLSGRFDFASGSRHATWLGAHVPVYLADGSRKPAVDGSTTPYTLLFPRESVEVKDTWQVIGLKGTGSDSYVVEDLFVPEHRVVARHLSTPRRVAGRLYALTQSNLYASSFSGLALGIARAYIDDFVGRMRDTIPRGAARSRGHNHVVQSKVGQSEARLRSARAFLYETVEEIWSTVQSGADPSLDELVRLRLASTWATQQAREIIADLYLAAGALAIFESQPFERRFRDIHTVAQQIQGHAAHFETCGQILMGMKPDRSMFTF